MPNAEEINKNTGIAGDRKGVWHLLTPSYPQCVLVLAHGAGAGMKHSFIETLAARLEEQGIATVRFNFPFTENKKARPDSPAIAHQDIQATIAKTREPELVIATPLVDWKFFASLLETAAIIFQQSNRFPDLCLA